MNPAIDLLFRLLSICYVCLVVGAIPYLSTSESDLAVRVRAWLRIP